MGCKEIGVSGSILYTKFAVFIFPEFLSSDARVVCRWLGFGAFGAQATSMAFFGQSSYYIMDDVECKGTRGNIFIVPIYSYNSNRL